MNSFQKRMSPYLLGMLWAFCAVCIALSAEHYWRKHSTPPGIMLGFDIPTIQPLSDVPEEALERGLGESPVGYVARMSSVVHLSTSHCAPQDFTLSWVEMGALQVSAVFNNPMAEDGGEYAFQQGILARERFVCGYCHQRAYILSDIIRDAGIASEVFVIEGHVVLKFEVEEQEYLVDPDYGTSPIPYYSNDASLADAILLSYASAYAFDPDLLIPMFLSREDNRLYDLNLDARRDFQRQLFWRADMLSFVLGLVGILGSAGLALTVATRARRRQPHRKLCCAIG